MLEPTNLTLTVGKVTFPHPIFVAAGVYKTVEQINDLALSDVMPVWGSFTTEPSEGNGGKDYHAEYHVCQNGERVLLHTINSIGLTNPGMKYAERHASEAIARHRNEGKPLSISVSGKGRQDLLNLTKKAVDAGFPVAEANGACPNDRGIPIFCYDLEAVSWYFDRVDEEIGDTDCVLLWKVSCGMPRSVLDHNRQCVARSKAFKGIITGNTVPDAFDYDEEGKLKIDTTNGISRGGMAGPAILPISLGHANFCAAGMPTGKVVYGCGGIRTVHDILKYKRAGAKLYGINSAYGEAGKKPAFITDLLHGLSFDGMRQAYDDLEPTL